MRHIGVPSTRLLGVRRASTVSLTIPSRLRSATALASADLLGVSSAVALTSGLLLTWLRSSVTPEASVVAISVALGVISGLTTVLAAWATDLYPGPAIGHVEHLRRRVLGALGAGGLVSLAIGALGDTGLSAVPGIMPTLALLSAAAAFVAALIARGAVQAGCASKPWWGTPGVLVDMRMDGGDSLDRDARLERAGVRIVSRVECSADGHPDHLSTIVRQAARIGAGVVVVVAPNGVDTESLTTKHDAASVPGIHVLTVRSWPLTEAEAVVLRHGGVTSRAARDRRMPVKRVLDLALALPVALLAAPIVLVAAAWIRIASRGPVFFQQLRGGRLGVDFPVLKLRTMHVDAEALLERHLAENPAAKEMWQRRFKLDPDPRIIPGGGFLRRSSIDELPQLLNVLLGQMSLVGPRPFPLYHLEQFDPEFRRLRSTMPPGLTGVWQVTSRSSTDLAGQEVADRAYIEHWSPWLDAYLVMMTVRAVVSGKGAC